MKETKETYLDNRQFENVRVQILYEETDITLIREHKEKERADDTASMSKMFDLMILSNPQKAACYHFLKGLRESTKDNRDVAFDYLLRYKI